MSCSRARSVITNARRPSISVVRPTSRPGICRSERPVAGEQAEVGTAELGGDAQRLSLPRRDVGAVFARRRQHRQRDRLDHGHEERPRGMGQLRRMRHRLQQSEGVGLAQDHARHRSLIVGQLGLQRGQVGGAVRERGQLLELEGAGAEVGPRRLDVVAVDGATDEHALTPGGADGHQRRLGRGRGAVVVGGGDDRQARQLGDERLELVDGLERALADLRLVGRVGGVELAAREHRVDRGRDVVLVHAGTEERDEVGAVAPGQGRQLAAEGQLRDRIGQVQAVGAHGWGDIVEQLLDRLEAERGQHLRARVRGVGAVDHAVSRRSSGHRQRHPAAPRPSPRRRGAGAPSSRPRRARC